MPVRIFRNVTTDMRIFGVSAADDEAKMPTRDLDGFDRRILAIVQIDADLTSEQLAAKVGLSASAVQRRLKRLKADGVIMAQVAVLNPDALGRPSVFIVGLELERERPELSARLRAWLAKEAAIQQIFYVTGASDFILVIVTAGVAEYDALMSRLMAENANVRRFTTNVALGVLKQRLAIPIPD